MCRIDPTTTGRRRGPENSESRPQDPHSRRASSYARRWLALLLLLSVTIAVPVSGGQAQSTPAALIGGNGAMANRFNVNVEGYHAVNTYLLAYFATLMYPDNLATVFHPYAPVAGDARATARDQALKNSRRETLAGQMHNDFSLFLARYKEATEHLFTGVSVTYQGVNRCQPGGIEVYDPEAVLISTPSAVFVILRGTDRVDCAATDIGRQWYEWVGTDFIFWQETPVAPTWMQVPRTTTFRAGTPLTIGGPGALVHRGFWQTILVADAPPQSIVSKVRQLSGSGSKKIWIAGHSLGAAQAQALAVLLTGSGLRPQGVYAYAAPHIGNPALVSWMNQNIGMARLQRFDFINDPITILPTYLLANQRYARAGTRNYYDDVQTFQRGARERLAAEDFFTAFYTVPTVFPASATAGARAVVKANLNATLPSSPAIVPFCFHYPHWYVRAAHNQVSSQLRGMMPNPAALGMPAGSGDWSPCNQATVDRGMQRSVVDVALATAESAIQDVKFSVTQLFANVSGSALTEGQYYIRSYRNPNLYLAASTSCAGQNRCGVVLTTQRTRLTIRKALGAGYHIEQRIGTKDQRVELEGSQLATEGGRVQLFDVVLTPNQKWLFYRTPNNGPFVIKNVAGVVNKVIDARGCSSAGCSPRSYFGVNDRQEQLWVVERAN